MVSMQNTLLLTLANLRKNKGQAVSMLILAFLAAMLLNLGLLSWIDYPRSFDEQAKQLNSADAMLTMYRTDNQADCTAFLQKQSSIKAVESQNALFFPDSSYPYRDGNMTQRVAFLDLSDAKKRRISKLTIAEEQASTNAQNYAAYVPYIMKISGGYALGDTFTVTYLNTDYSFEIVGFFHDMMLASVNVGGIGLYLPHKSYVQLQQELEKNQIPSDSTMYFVQANDPEDTTILSDFCTEYSEETSMSWRITLPLTKMARTFTANICAMVLVAFSLILLLVCLIVIRFRIHNSIKDDMQNIGALKAVGHTSGQIIRAILLQFSLPTLCGGALGMGLSYLLLPTLSSAFALQSGLVWEPGFDPVLSIGGLLGLVVLVALVALLAARRIRTLHPIVALRGGLVTHNFRKNHCPLECTHGPLHLLLALKATLQNWRQNIMISIIIAAVSYACVFALTMFENMVMNPDTFIKMVVDELCTVNTVFREEDYDESYLQQVREMDGVERAIAYQSERVTMKGNDVICYITPDYDEVSNDSIYEGRYPKHGNEAALGGEAADQLNIAIGDTITISAYGEEQDYLVTGFLQTANDGGWDMQLTTDGIKRLNPDYIGASLYIDLADDVDTDAFIERMDETFGDAIVRHTIYQDIIDASLGMYTLLVSVLACIILAITVFVVALILHLVIQSLLVRRKQELGIQKAVGFTTGQLMRQISLSFLPVAAIGSVLGVTLGAVFMNPMLSVLFRTLGIMQSNLTVNAAWMVALAIVICALSYLIALLAARRVRKISPCVMIAE